MDREFPPNSNTRRREPAPSAPPEREVASVVAKKVIVRNKPLRRRFFETFAGDGNKGVFEYVIMQVIAPGAKDIVADAANSLIDRTLYGEDYRPSRRGPRRGNGGYTSYSRMSESAPRQRREEPRSRRETAHRSDQTEIIVETRTDAEMILDSMFEILSKYEVVTRRDLMSLAGEPRTPTDENWGWTDLRGARAQRVRDGYLLDLPRPEPLD